MVANREDNVGKLSTSTVKERTFQSGRNQTTNELEEARGQIWIGVTAEHQTTLLHEGKRERRLGGPKLRKEVTVGID